MARRVLLVAAAFAALACAYTWPLILHPRSLVAHDRGDPLLVTWILWWSTHTLPLTEAWWNAPAFYPSTGVFAFSENLLGLAPIAAPIIWITKEPLPAYNAAFLLSYVLSGLGAYLLGFVLTRRHEAAFVAAIAFAFAPYRLSHQHHLQLLSSYWMPVAIAALHLHARDPRPRWAALFAASWLLQALACGYYFFYLTLFAVLWLAWFAPRRWTVKAAATLGAAWLAAAIVLAPVLAGYRAIQAGYGFKRSPVEILNYSADVAGLWSAAPDSLVWHWLHGAGVSSESEQFPGLTILALAGVAIAMALTRRANRGHVLFYTCAAILMWALSLGPEPRLLGVPIGIPGPYAALTSLPGFDGMRVPARLWMVAVICLSACAAIAVAAVASPRAQRWIAAAATIALLLDGWPRALAMLEVPPMRVTKAGPMARLGLPMGETETLTMYGAIAQQRAVFNGYSGYTAPQHPALLDLLEARDPRILPRLAATRPVEILVEHATDPSGTWRAWMDGTPGATRVDAGDGWTSYTIGPTGFVAPPPATGVRLAVAAIAASTDPRDSGAVLDDNLESRWFAARQNGSEVITLDLGAPRAVRAIVMCLGAYPSQYPRELAVDVSPDGAGWTPVRDGGTALETYDAAVRSPRDVPVTIPIGRDQVRFIRMRQTQAAPRKRWSIVELRVIGDAAGR